MPGNDASSHSEYLAVALLDHIGRLVDAGRVVLPFLDARERRTPGLLLGVGVKRTQAADVDQELLALRRVAIGLEQLGRVRVRRPLQEPVRPDDQRRALLLNDV